MRVKRLYIQRFSDGVALAQRRDTIEQSVQNYPNSEAISLRVYLSEDDESILMEKWIFADAETEAHFKESVSPLFDNLPEADFDDDLGDLTLRKDVEWDE